MIKIFLGKRQVEEYVDYQFLEIENNNIEYIVKSPTEEDTHEFFDNLELESVFLDNELISNNPSSDQIETIYLAFKAIQPIADELKKRINQLK